MPDTKNPINAPTVRFGPGPDRSLAKGALQKNRRMPASYGKSSKDAERPTEETSQPGEDLPDDKVGLSSKSIKGHLDRLNLLLRTATSESLATLAIGQLVNAITCSMGSRHAHDP